MSLAGIIVVFGFVISACSVPVEVKIDNGVRKGEKVQQLIDEYDPEKAYVAVDESTISSGTSFKVKDAYFILSYTSGESYFDLTNMLVAKIANRWDGERWIPELHIYMD